MLLLVFLLGTALASAQECQLSGRCINSNLVSLTAADSSTQCLQDCKDYAGCHWYTYKEKVRTICELFADCNELSTEDCDFCVSGQKECDLYQCDIPGFCTVSLISNHLNQDTLNT